MTKTIRTLQKALAVAVCVTCTTIAPVWAASEAVIPQQVGELSQLGRNVAALPRGTPVAHLDRTFSTDLDGNGRLDSVYFDRANNLIAACFDALAETCRLWRLGAVLDIVPARRRDAEGSAMIALGPRGALLACELSPLRHLVCSAATSALDRLDVSVVRAGRGSLVFVRDGVDEYTCTSWSGRDSGQCSSARGFSYVSGGLLLARFAMDGESISALAFRDGVPELCLLTTGGVKCVTARGLDRFHQPGARFATAWSQITGRTYLLGFFGTEVAVCRPKSDVSTFDCRYAAVRPIALDSRLMVVAARGRRSGLVQREWVATLPSFSERRTWALQAVQSGAASALAAHDVTVSQAANFDDEIAAAMAAARRDLNSVVSHVPSDQSVSVSTMVIGVDDEEGGEMFGLPALYEFWNDLGGYLAIWSDSYDVLLAYSIANQQARDQCLNSCDASKDADEGLCHVLAGVVVVGGLLSTGAVTVGTALTGPGAIGTFAAGMTITATGAALVDQLCTARAWAEWAYCRSRC